LWVCVHPETAEGDWRVSDAEKNRFRIETSLPRKKAPKGLEVFLSGLPCGTQGQGLTLMSYDFKYLHPDFRIG
jgi:hypothetical protein